MHYQLPLSWHGFLEMDAFEHMKYNYTSLAPMNQKKVQQTKQIVYYMD